MARAVDRVVWCDAAWMPINYGFCPSAKAWRRETRAINNGGHPYPTDEGCCTTFTEDDGSVCCIVTVADDRLKAAAKDPVALAAVFVHEATHVWQTMRDKIGEEKPSAEFEAYTMTSIFENLMAAYQRTRPVKVVQRAKSKAVTKLSKTGKAKRRG